MPAVPATRFAMPIGAAASLLFAACSFDTVDLSEKGCPCASGFTCDSVRNRCIESSTDAGAPDAPDAPRPNTECDRSLSMFDFCESFESTELPQWDGRIQMNGDSVVVTMPTFRGAGALGAFSTAGNAIAGRLASSFEFLERDEMFWRVYVLLPAASPLQGISIFALSGETADEVVVWGLGPDGALAFTGAEMEFLSGPPAEFPRDEWVCVQGRTTISRGEAEIEMRFNGTTVLDVSGRDNLPSSPYNSVVVGVLQTGPLHPPTQVFFDELVVDTNRMIPCEP